MSEIKRVKREEAVLAVIDLQGRMLSAIDDSENTVAASNRLIRGCRILGVPLLVTQQYTKGLGETVAETVSACTEELGAGTAPAVFAPIEKRCFSAAGADEFMRQLEASGRKSVILCGTESHVCVAQTGLDLLERGYKVFVAADAVSSRKRSDKKTALRRLSAEGAAVSSVEAILFEILKGAEESGFKQISNLVK
ncbi:MAG: hydrolase [Clostridiales Family XIII bacterium]|jgi:nicotinamidase-related amidase|nr:hydrolase [Clostridiales Family XIII bacterium]